MLDLRPHHTALRVLVSYPVLSAAVDHTTASTLQHITEEGRGGTGQQENRQLMGYDWLKGNGSER